MKSVFVREKQTSYDFSHMWKINKMHKLNINKYVDTENSVVLTRREGVREGEMGGGANWRAARFENSNGQMTTKRSFVYF